jgi:hypothetical protein
MVLSSIFRYLLLALLPVIALALYGEGQKYDPALLDFRSSSAYSDQGTSFFPPTLEDFSKAGQIRLYSKENLFEYVNGHAEYFISAGFVSLSVAEYIKTGTEPDQPDVVIDVYDMGNSIQAFGVLVDETGTQVMDVPIGMMGFETSRGIRFIKDRFYVKIDSYNEEIQVMKFARSIEEEIQAGDESFSVFSRFPDLGEILATRYVKEAYRGLGFLHDVIEREYSLDGNSIQVFLIEGEEKNIHGLTTSFLDYFIRSEIDFVRLERKGKTIYKVVDPYEGDWFLLPLQDVLFGVFGTEDETILDSFIT